MTDKDKTCDVCGHNEFYAGVACSGLGAFSCAFCQICIGMAAEMIFMIEGTIESCNGIENVHVDMPLIYFDKEKDSYIDYRNKEAVTIKTTTGKEFEKRSDYIDYQEKLLLICKCPTPNCWKSIDITGWSGEDPKACMCCCEQFEFEEVDTSTFQWIEKTW